MLGSFMTKQIKYNFVDHNLQISPANHLLSGQITVYKDHWYRVTAAASPISSRSSRGTRSVKLADGRVPFRAAPLTRCRVLCRFARRIFRISSSRPLDTLGRTLPLDSTLGWMFLKRHTSSISTVRMTITHRCNSVSKALEMSLTVFHPHSVRSA